MTLPFSTHINGSPSFFAEKIWHGLYSAGYGDREYSKFNMGHIDKYGREFDQPPSSINLKAKIHTIRRDASFRWKAGNKIHMVFGNRTPFRYQFAPTLSCTGVQEIFLSNSARNGLEISVEEAAQGYPYLYRDAIERLAINDGFESIEDFKEYFFPNNIDGSFSGRIIHWTEVRY